MHNLFMHSSISDRRNICPHLRHWQEKSLSFSNYYNHTVATYRGIISQLFSGYQLKNTDSNNLVSIQGMLSGRGYRTEFLNVEPMNATFTGYLEKLGFEEVRAAIRGNGDPQSSIITDKEAYESLLERAVENAKKQAPFFICMYSVGTHVSFDSPDVKYGDGSSPMLNKFFNLDTQFNKFMEEFEKLPVSNGTLVVFTADHCTVEEDEYLRTFSMKNRSSMADAIPLFFYYPGIEPGEIDADGRNSIDLVPTLLDYLDMDGENYFLGNSMFSVRGDNGNEFDTVFFDGSKLETTVGGGAPSPLEAGQEKIIRDKLSDYFKAAR